MKVVLVTHCADLATELFEDYLKARYQKAASAERSIFYRVSFNFTPDRRVCAK